MDEPSVSPSAGRQPLAVGMNLLWMGEQAGGIGRYAQELIPALLAAEPGMRLVAFVHRDPPSELTEASWADQVEWVRLPIRRDGLPIHVLAQLLGLPQLARRRGLDVLHNPANIGALWSPGIANVLTLTDLVWIHHPEGWEDLRTARRMRRVAVRCARAADRVITISQAVREDFVRTIDLDADRIDVTPLGVRADAPEPGLPEDQLREKLGLGERRYVLCVSQKRPYKNQEALVRALPALDGVDLVLPGAPTPYEARLREIARELGVQDRLHTPPWVSEAELEALYRHAACFCLPSLFEGFGLPILEAMARGVPVACSNVWSLPEVAADAALLFDPYDQPTITAAVQRLLEDTQLAQRLGEEGRRRARYFTWERTARGTLAAYRRAIAQRGAGVRSSHSRFRRHA